MLRKIEELPYSNVYYTPNMFEDSSPDLLVRIFDVLDTTIPWTQGYVKRGKERRKTCLFADTEGTYRYAGKTMEAVRWNPLVEAIKKNVEAILIEQFPEWKEEWSFDTCLCNRYKNGRKSRLGYHSDSEIDLVPNSPIASVSFGTVRKFHFKCNTTKDKEQLDEEHPLHNRVVLRLGVGSLLVMGAYCQKYYKHEVPPEASVTEPRINLTFRRTKRHQ